MRTWRRGWAARLNLYEDEGRVEGWRMGAMRKLEGLDQGRRVAEDVGTEEEVEVELGGN